MSKEKSKLLLGFFGLFFYENKGVTKKSGIDILVVEIDVINIIVELKWL